MPFPRECRGRTGSRYMASGAVGRPTTDGVRGGRPLLPTRSWIHLQAHLV